MKLTFKLVAATDINTFNELVTERLAQGYKFVSGQQMIIREHETINGAGYQYSIAMLLEEGDQNAPNA